jgi:hypothetical protein
LYYSCRLMYNIKPECVTKHILEYPELCSEVGCQKMTACTTLAIKYTHTHVINTCHDLPIVHFTGGKHDVKVSDFSHRICHKQVFSQALDKLYQLCIL